MSKLAKWREGAFGRRADRRASSRILHRLGAVVAHSTAGLMAALFVAAWVAEGAVAHFPHWWELTLYSATASVTFVMVFVIQHTTSRQVAAIQRKLDELIRSTDAGNVVIGLEDAPDHDLEELGEQAAVDRLEALQEQHHPDLAGPR